MLERHFSPDTVTYFGFSNRDYMPDWLFEQWIVFFYIILFNFYCLFVTTSFELSDVIFVKLFFVTYLVSIWIVGVWSHNSHPV